MANPWVEMVREFHIKLGQPISDYPGIFDRRKDLRVKLIKEECEETLEEIQWCDIAGTADGLVDLIYVCIGASLEFGIDLDPIFAEVHRTNMLKVGGATREDGKILKPEGWQKPRIAELLMKQTAGASCEIKK